MQKDLETEPAAVRPRDLALARNFIRASGLRTDAKDIAGITVLSRADSKKKSDFDGTITVNSEKVSRITVNDKTYKLD